MTVAGSATGPFFANGMPWVIDPSFIRRQRSGTDRKVSHVSNPDPSGAPMLNVRTFRRAEVAWYGLAVVLVLTFVNSFALWRWLDARLPAVALTAIPFILASPIVLWAMARLHRGVPRSRLPWIALALGLAVVSFWITDPDFPAKRSHIAEYIVLALVVRRALAFRLDGGWLGLAAGLVAALLGVHDELLQGLHPARYFGVPDLAVNGLAAASGACLGHGFMLFDRTFAGNRSPTPRCAGDRVAWLAIAVALGALVFLLAAIARLPGDLVPPWAFAPLLAAAVLWALVCLDARVAPQLAWTAALVVWLSVAAIVEPVLGNVTPLDFS